MSNAGRFMDHLDTALTVSSPWNRPSRSDNSTLSHWTDNRWSRSSRADSDEDETHPPGSPRQDLRHALGYGLEVSRTGPKKKWDVHAPTRDSNNPAAVAVREPSLIGVHSWACCVVCLRLFRLLVSASQDGKLIVWDSYTTNKVKSAQ